MSLTASSVGEMRYFMDKVLEAISRNACVLAEQFPDGQRFLKIRPTIG